jgi:hypothetical protein
MPRYIIEREIDRASELSQEALAEIARTSNDAVASLGVPYTWVRLWGRRGRGVRYREVGAARGCLRGDPGRSDAAWQLRPRSSPSWPSPAGAR